MQPSRPKKDTPERGPETGRAKGAEKIDTGEDPSAYPQVVELGLEARCWCCVRTSSVSSSDSSFTVAEGARHVRGYSVSGKHGAWGSYDDDGRRGRGKGARHQGLRL